MRHATAVPSLVAGLLACGGSEGGGEVTTSRDTTVEFHGAAVPVRIVENPAEPPASAPAWRLGAEPLLDLGGEAEARDALFRVGGAVRLSDGRVVVADAGSSSLKFFDASGALVRTVGGSGAGPGEFRGMQMFAGLPGDSLAVFDLNLARLTVFLGTGEVARDVRVGASAESPRSNLTGSFGDGTYLARGFVDLDGRAPEGLERHVSELFRLGADGLLLDSLGAVPGGEGWFAPFGQGGFSFHIPPFARRTEVQAGAGRLVIGDSEHPEIHVHDPDGTPRAIVRRAAPDVPVDDTAVAAARAAALAAAQERSRPDVERMFAEMPMPDDVPSFSDVRVAEDGHLWVRTWQPAWETHATADWRVFDGDGRLVARITLPATLQPTQIGSDFVLGIWRDPLEVEHVRLYALERGAERR